VTATPTTTATATPNPRSTATPTPTPFAYEASAGASFDEWTLPESWRQENGLVTEGGGDAEWVLAPIRVERTANYAVEVTFQAGETDTCPRSFGVAIRGNSAGYYAGGIEWGCDPAVRLWAGQNVLAEQPFDITDGPHVLRVEAVGNRISVSVDGEVVVSASDASNPTGSQIALWSNGVPVTVTSVKVVEIRASVNGPAAAAPDRPAARKEEVLVHA
jgi:hypothetical protein